jgi:hypothetical protein
VVRNTKLKPEMRRRRRVGEKTSYGFWARVLGSGCAFDSFRFKFVGSMRLF